MNASTLELERILAAALGEAAEGHTLAEQVAMLVSQRENARNAWAAYKAERDEIHRRLSAVVSAFEK